MIGFEQSIYTVDETDGSVEVCAIVVSGDKQPRAIIIIFTSLTTESDTTTGEFVYSITLDACLAHGIYHAVKLLV